MRSPAAVFDLRTALSGEVSAALNQLEAANDEAKALHRCRLHLKRARTLAKIGAAAAPRLAGMFEQGAQACMRALAPARHRAALSALARKAAKRQRKRAAAALRATAEALAADGASVDADSLERARAGLRDLLALAQVWPEPSPRQVARGADRIKHAARRARRRGCGAGSMALRHDWRKREKERLFAAELLGPAWPARRRRKHLRRLEATLGEERDLYLLIAQLEAQTETSAHKDALRALRQRKRKLMKRADALGAKLRTLRA